jgi:integrase
MRPAAGARSAASCPASSKQAVLHQAIASSLVRELERIESPKGHAAAKPRGLTTEERRQLLAYVDTDKVAIAADLPDLIRFAIGTGLRIGELCAVRWMDVNLDGLAVVSEHDMRLVPVVAVRQNVSSVGSGTSKQLIHPYGNGVKIGPVEDGP